MLNDGSVHNSLYSWASKSFKYCIPLLERTSLGTPKRPIKLNSSCAADSAVYSPELRTTPPNEKKLSIITTTDDFH
jgi:hypothetical protein